MKQLHLPPVYFGLALLVMLALHIFVPAGQYLGGPWRLIGVPVLLLGLATGIAAALEFRQHETAIHPHAEALSLVTTGVYGWSRNPMYLGLVLILIGIALLLGTSTPTLVPPIFAFLVDQLFIQVEEERLAEQFGRDFDLYRQRVRRWI